MSSKEKNTNRQARVGDEVEVLYQRMGDRWFAFSLIDDEVFVGSITPDELQEKKTIEAPGKNRRNKVYRKAGNS
jgi:hypothetical protein